MNRTDALEELRGSMPPNPEDDHGWERAARVVIDTEPKRTEYFFCPCGARITAVNVQGPGETLRFPDSYIPGDHIDPCTCEPARGLEP